MTIPIIILGQLALQKYKGHIALVMGKVSFGN